MAYEQGIAILWHRRDLRIEDNAGLYRALKSGVPVLPLFIFDREILDDLEAKADARVEFIYDRVIGLQHAYANAGGAMLVYYGRPEEVWPEVLRSYPVKHVYTNRDYEPYAKGRDSALVKQFEAEGITFNDYKDQVIFDRDEVLSQNGKPYGVFTPYKRAWLAKLNAFYQKAYPVEAYFNHLAKVEVPHPPTLSAMGFERKGEPFPSDLPDGEVIRNYDEIRNTPAVESSRESLALRFGTVSIRKLVREAGAMNEKYLSELIWRDFFFATPLPPARNSL